MPEEIIRHQPVTVTSSAVFDLSDIAGGIPSPCSGVVVSCEGQAVRWSADGILVPSPTLGVLLPAGAELELRSNLAAFNVIAVTGSAVLTFTFYAN